MNKVWTSCEQVMNKLWTTLNFSYHSSQQKSRNLSKLLLFRGGQGVARLNVWDWDRDFISFFFWVSILSQDPGFSPQSLNVKTKPRFFLLGLNVEMRPRLFFLSFNVKTIPRLYLSLNIKTRLRQDKDETKIFFKTRSLTFKMSTYPFPFLCCYIFSRNFCLSGSPYLT